jgi:hypothetical protein
MAENFEQLVNDLEADRAKAMMHGDINKLSVLFADELYYGHSGGYWDNKADFIRKVREGTYLYHYVSCVVRGLMPIPDNAIVIHVMVTIAMKLHGAEKTMKSIYLAVWKRDGSKWRFLAHQTALIKDS